MRHYILALLMGTLLIGGCSDENDRRKRDFIHGCMDGGYISKKECACIYEELDRQISEEQWQRMERSGVTEAFLRQMQAATGRCTRR